MTFQVGTSGNPNGKPAGTKSQKTITKNRQRIAVQVLENLMTDTSIEPAIRMQSAVAILFNQTAA